MTRESKKVLAPADPGSKEDASAGTTNRMLKSAEIFSSSQEVVIEHRGEHYRLRCTSNGKLILTK